MQGVAKGPRPSLHVSVDRLGPLLSVDEQREQWMIPRPKTLPPPIHGAKGYKVTLREASLVQVQGGRERSVRMFDSTHEYDSELLLCFSEIKVEAGQGLGGYHPLIGEDELPCWNTNIKQHECEQIQELRCDRDEDRLLDDEGLLGDERLQIIAEREAALVPKFSHDIDIQFDLVKDRFVLGYHILDENGRFVTALCGRSYVTTVWWLLGHAPSAVVLPPRSRRRQADALSTWLQKKR